MRFFLALMLLLAPAYAVAGNSVAIESQVFVERFVKAPDGQRKAVLEAPKTVVPGDRLVYILRYRNGGSAPARNFVIVNPMPRAVAFQGTSDSRAELSVDGGKGWGQIETLKIVEANGHVRGARLEDVTHIRWSLRKAIPVGGTGQTSFRGIVR